MKKVDFIDFVKDHLIKFGVPSDTSLFIACQSALETAFGTSLICTENHNLFGMKFPKKRCTTAICESRCHAFYDNYLASIADFIIWLSCNGFTKRSLTNLDEFISRLRNSSFNPSSDYVDRIMKIYKLYYYD